MISAIAAAVCNAAPQAERIGAPTLTRHTFREIAMGCEVRIELAAASEEEAVAAAQVGFERIRALDESLSDYLASSEVRKLPLSPAASTALSPDLCDAMNRALIIAKSTFGSFDPTAGTLARLWRAARHSGQLPSHESIDTALAKCGYEHLSLDLSECTLRSAIEGIELDFGGLGKGLAAQAARDAITKVGVGVVLVAVAGDIACGDSPPWAPGWSVDLQSGVEGDESEHLILANCCLSTSGDAEQHIDVAGVRYSHIFDPRTGQAITMRRAATVLTRDGAVADALATALTVDPSLIDPSRHDLRSRLGPFEARVVTRDLAGTVCTVATAGWGGTTPSGLAVLSDVPPAGRESRPATGGAARVANSAASTAAGR